MWESTVPGVTPVAGASKRRSGSLFGKLCFFFVELQVLHCFLWVTCHSFRNQKFWILRRLWKAQLVFVYGIELQFFTVGGFLELHYAGKLARRWIRLLGGLLRPQPVLVHLWPCGLAEWLLSKIFIASIKRRLLCFADEWRAHSVYRILVYRCSSRIWFENWADWLLISDSGTPLIISLHCCLVIDHCFRAASLVHLSSSSVVPKIGWVLFCWGLRFYYLVLLHNQGSSLLFVSFWGTPVPLFLPQLLGLLQLVDAANLTLMLEVPKLLLIVIELIPSLCGLIEVSSYHIIHTCDSIGIVSCIIRLSSSGRVLSLFSSFLFHNPLLSILHCLVLLDFQLIVTSSSYIYTFKAVVIRVLVHHFSILTWNLVGHRHRALLWRA